MSGSSQQKVVTVETVVGEPGVGKERYEEE